MTTPVATIDTETIATETLFTVQRPHKVVVVHAGARDSYQVALALHEAGLLETLITDLFWPLEPNLANSFLNNLLPAVAQLLRRRSADGLPGTAVTQHAIEGLRGLLMDRLPRLPLALRRHSTRAADANLGKIAGRRARVTGSGLLTYSYFGFDAMRSYGRAAMLFQVHPHPTTVRRILQTELQDHPDCAASLQQEWELLLPPDDYAHLVEEPGMAASTIVASSFTKKSLLENGATSSRITVIPYGVDLKVFRPASEHVRVEVEPLKLLFVGRINQRKGIKYLLEAVRTFSAQQVHLTVCGRVVDDLELFRSAGEQVQVKPSLNLSDLVKEYQTADLFVFPSVAEGFGQVLLESLACGLPILSTFNTAAPDLIEDGVQGFIVEPRRPDLLVERIQWALEHPSELHAMRKEARGRAEHFTWNRFRKSIAKAVEHYLSTIASG